MLNESTVTAQAPTKTKPASEAVEALSHELPRDEKEVLSAYRKAKNMGYADINISIQEGKRVKLWLTEKLR